MKKMKKKIITLFLMLITLCMIMMLSGCGEHYPAIKIFTGAWSSYINIDVGKPYIYKGFDITTTNDGKNLILHFEKGETS